MSTTDDVLELEMDAIDEQEWESEQHTPVASDTKLEALVRQTVPTPPVATPTAPADPSARPPTFARTTTRAGTAHPRATSPSPVAPRATSQVVPRATSPSTTAPRAVSASPITSRAPSEPARRPKTGDLAPVVTIPPKAARAGSRPRPAPGRAPSSPATPIVRPDPPAPPPAVDAGWADDLAIPTTDTPSVDPAPAVATAVPARPATNPPVATAVPARPATNPPVATAVPARPATNPPVATAVPARPATNPPVATAVPARPATNPPVATAVPARPATNPPVAGMPAIAALGTDPMSDPAVVAPAALAAPVRESAPLMSADAGAPTTAAGSPSIVVSPDAISPAPLRHAPPPRPPTVRATPPTAYPVVDPSLLAHTSVAAERAADASAAHASAQQSAQQSWQQSAQQSAGLPIAAVSATSASASTASMTAGSMPFVESKLAGGHDVLVPTKRRGLPLVWLGAGGALIVAIVAIVALRGGSNGTAKVSPTSPAPAVVADPTPIANPGSAAAVVDDTANGSAIAEAGSGATLPDTDPVDTTPAPIPAPKSKRVAFGGKKLVLDYDTAPAAPKATSDAGSITTARRAYLSGNKRLFAGDADGAIRLYREALAVYPGYVAGYRGLGLAYAQKGDKANALRALRTYVAAVPKAKDIPIIQKRIASLAR